MWSGGRVSRMVFPVLELAAARVVGSGEVAIAWTACTLNGSGGRRVCYVTVVEQTNGACISAACGSETRSAIPLRVQPAEGRRGGWTGSLRHLSSGTGILLLHAAARPATMAIVATLHTPPGTGRWGGVQPTPGHSLWYLRRRRWFKTSTGGCEQGCSNGYRAAVRGPVGCAERGRLGGGRRGSKGHFFSHPAAGCPKESEPAEEDCPRANEAFPARAALRSCCDVAARTLETQATGTLSQSLARTLKAGRRKLTK